MVFLREFVNFLQHLETHAFQMNNHQVLKLSKRCKKYKNKDIITSIEV